MCAGGVIAYEMARQLTTLGERVDLVLILDAATPQAARRPYLATKHRMARISQMIRGGLEINVSASRKLGNLLFATTRKAWNMAAWEVTTKVWTWTVAARFRLLGILLSRKLPWPRVVPTLSVRQIYESAEATYVPKSFVGPQIVLVRASAGDFGDTPYVNLFVDSTFGWAKVVHDLSVTDVDGGHFSMLQEPYVESLAGVVRQLLKPRAALTLAAADEPA
jgi:thioesterase domain-containing protein